ncbi:MAG: lipopolysaccharide kinase InaA family protein [Pseudomonadales bacterium]
MMPPVTTLRALQYAAREIATPFSLALPDGSRLLCTDVLRLLPEKRIVLRATLGEKTVLAKLFFDAANWQKEITQYALLENTGVKTPELLTQYTLEQGGVCLYSFIDQAQPLDLLWQQADEEKKKRYLDLLLPCLQTLWQQKILQQDLHLGNFLLQGNDTLWMLDPASCKHYTHASEQQNNCALFLAQLPLSDWSFVAQHCQFDDAIQTLAAKQWQLRLKNYQKKILRDCTEIADISPHNNLHILCRRAFLNDAWRDLLQNPSTLQQDAVMLKNGNSAKVFRIEVNGAAFVVKQYINKDWLRKLRRAFRVSRAARSWHFAHALAFAGVRVPKPVALIEQKTGPIVTSAWFISEYCADTDLLTRWQTQEPTKAELHNLRALFNALLQLRSHHGDMKATNLLSDGNTLAVIDYDGAQQHRHSSTLNKALQKDRQRFLQNWADKPQLQQRLAEWIAP